MSQEHYEWQDGERGLAVENPGGGALQPRDLYDTKDYKIPSGIVSGEPPPSITASGSESVGWAASDPSTVTLASAGGAMISPQFYPMQPTQVTLNARLPRSGLPPVAAQGYQYIALPAPMADWPHQGSPWNVVYSDTGAPGASSQMEYHGDAPGGTGSQDYPKAYRQGGGGLLQQRHHQHYPAGRHPSGYSARSGYGEHVYPGVTSSSLPSRAHSSNASSRSASYYSEPGDTGGQDYYSKQKGAAGRPGQPVGPGGTGLTPAGKARISLGVQSMPPAQAYAMPTGSMTVEDLVGKVIMMARDQGGCRLLQSRLDMGDADMLKLVYREILPQVFSIVIDAFGNYLFQKLLETLTSVGDTRRRSTILKVLLGVLDPDVAIKADETGDYSKVIDGQEAIIAVRQSIASYAVAAGSRKGSRAVDAEHPDVTSLASGMGNLSVGLRSQQALSQPQRELDLHWSPFTRAALDLHGTRSLQKIVEFCTSPLEISLITECLREPDAVVRASCDPNGNHVISRCLTSLPGPEKEWLISAIADNLMPIACHRHGCCVIQRAFDASSHELHSRLLACVEERVLEMIQDPFANYVIQYILTNGTQVEARRLMAHVKGHVPELARQKFASNVVERCLQQADDALRGAIIDEMCGSGSHNAEKYDEGGAMGAAASAAAEHDVMGILVADPYGNYCVQRAVTVASTPQMEKLLAALKPHFTLLGGTPGGRRIFSRIFKKYPELAATMPLPSFPVPEPGDLRGGYYHPQQQQQQQQRGYYASLAPQPGPQHPGRHGPYYQPDYYGESGAGGRQPYQLGQPAGYGRGHYYGPHGYP